MSVNFPRAFILLQCSTFCLGNILQPYGFWLGHGANPAGCLASPLCNENISPQFVLIARLLPPNPVSIREML